MINGVKGFWQLQKYTNCKFLFFYSYYDIIYKSSNSVVLSRACPGSGLFIVQLVIRGSKTKKYKIHLYITFSMTYMYRHTGQNRNLPVIVYKISLFIFIHREHFYFHYTILSGTYAHAQAKYIIITRWAIGMVIASQNWLKIMEMFPSIPVFFAFKELIIFITVEPRYNAAR